MPFQRLTSQVTCTYLQHSCAHICKNYAYMFRAHITSIFVIIFEKLSPYVCAHIYSMCVHTFAKSCAYIWNRYVHIFATAVFVLCICVCMNSTVLCNFLEYPSVHIKQLFTAFVCTYFHSHLQICATVTCMSLQGGRCFHHVVLFGTEFLMSCLFWPAVD